MRVVRAIPSMGRELGFFPDHVGLLEGADRVLADSRANLPATELMPHMDFLRQCVAHDSRAGEVDLPNGVVTGRRTALFTEPWIDISTGSVLLPGPGKTVLVRGEVANWNATSFRFGRNRVRVSGRVFAPLATTNYFHQLLENGIRLIDLIEGRRVATEPLVVVKQHHRTAVEKAMYDGLIQAYPGISVQTFPTGTIVEPDEAVIHFPHDNYWEWPPVDRGLTGSLAGAFDRVYGGDAQAGGPMAIYLSRRGAKLRNAANEPELVEALAARGVEEFVASDDNHTEQIARFRAARVVVAVHGAGLTNLIFCRPGTRVIEIFPKNYVKSPYWRLAHRLDLRYRPVLAEPGDYHQNFSVDVDEVLAALEEV